VAGIEIQNVLIRRRRSWLVDAVGLFAVLAVLIMMGVLLFMSQVVIFIAPLFLVQLALQLLSNRWKEETPGTLRADDDGVRVDGHTLATRDEILHAFAVHGRPSVHVTVVPRREIELRTGSASEAQALLAELRRETAYVAPTFKVRMGRPGEGSGVLANLGQRARVTVGVSGLLVDRRFVGYEEIAGVEADETRLTVKLHEGSPLEFHGGPSPVLAKRIDEARRRHAAGASTSAALLARGGADVDAWKQRLRVATGDGADYRTAALPEDEVWRIVCDPSADATARAGAAAVLRPQLDDAGRERLRIAAETCAEPKLRAALEAAADADAEDDAALEDALAEIGEAERRASDSLP
jgi:hypothetical protein